LEESLEVTKFFSNLFRILFLPRLHISLVVDVPTVSRLGYLRVDGMVYVWIGFDEFFNPDLESF
jgi:hypothetical protein